MILLSLAKTKKSMTNLQKTMEKAKESGLVFNSDKFHICQPEISFFGNIYSKDGIWPDSTKFHDLRNLPVPKNKEELQKFLEMMNYLAAFIPNISMKAQTLRDPIKKNIPFEMSEDHIHSFGKLESTISEKSNPVLWSKETNRT